MNVCIHPAKKPENYRDLLLTILTAAAFPELTERDTVGEEVRTA